MTKARGLCRRPRFLVQTHLFSNLRRKGGRGPIQRLGHGCWPRDDSDSPACERPLDRTSLAFLLQALVQGNVLQLVLDSRPYPYQVPAMQQQLPQVPFFDTGNPDPGKTFLQQQAQDQPGIALIMLLLPPVLLPDFSRISHPHLVPQLLQQTIALHLARRRSRRVKKNKRNFRRPVLHS